MRAAPGQITARARRGSSRAAAVGLAIAVLTGFAACSGETDEPAPKESSAATSTPSPVATDAALGVVRGTLPKARADRVVADVTSVVESWSAGAFEGDYPRTDFSAAFTGFTAGARALAAKPTSLLSNVAVGSRLKSSRVASRLVRVDVLAPQGRLAGATARVKLVVQLAAGSTETTQVLTGRLMLTPTAAGWRVFGFDVRRGEGA